LVKRALMRSTFPTKSSNNTLFEFYISFIYTNRNKL